MNAVTPTGNGRLRAERVTLAHGGGGKAMRDLIEDVFTSVFEPDGLEDQARLSHEMLAVEGARLAFTTDSFVVQPLECGFRGDRARCSDLIARGIPR